jgi:hypothetical protein
MAQARGLACRIWLLRARPQALAGAAGARPCVRWHPASPPPWRTLRLRHGGGLDARGITERDQFEVLEQLVERLTGGDAPAKLHFITDRRALLDRAKEVYARHA